VDNPDRNANPLADPTVRVEYRRVVPSVVSPPPDDRDGTDAGRAGDDGPDDPSLAEFDPPTDGDRGGDAADTGRDDAHTAADHRARDEAGTGPASSTAASGSDSSPETTSESLRRTLDGLLPAASVDSRWWYWIAAVPAYFLVTLVGGVFAAVLVVFAGLLDVLGLGGLASLSAFVVFGGFAALFGLVGLAVAVGFPLAVYVDARAIEEAGGEWRPDPVLWGLSAVVAVLVTNFVLSVPLALYYLYRRHETLGTP
jgi:hypothetical protein